MKYILILVLLLLASGASFFFIKQNSVSEIRSNPQNTQGLESREELSQPKAKPMTFTPKMKKDVSSVEAKDSSKDTLLEEIRTMMPEATLANSDESIHDLMGIIDISEISEEDRELDIQEVLNSSSSEVPSSVRLEKGKYIMAPEGLKKTD